MKFLLSTVLSLSLLGAASTHAAAYDLDLDRAIALSLTLTTDGDAALARTIMLEEARQAKASEAADAAYARSLAGGGGGGSHDDNASLAIARRLEAEDRAALESADYAAALVFETEQVTQLAAERQAAEDRDRAMARQLEEDTLTADLLAAQAQNSYDAASAALARRLSAEEERPARVIHDVRAQLSRFPAALPAPEAVRPLVGCKNLGGTCSVNAVLQILRHCPYMRSIITMTPESNLKPALLATIDHTAGPLDPLAYVSMNNSEATTFIESIARIINANATLLPLITDIDLANSIEAVHDRRAPNAPAFVVLSTGRATAASLQETVTMGGVTYDLTGVVVHTGGHFFASVKQAGAWHGLDDLATGAIGDMPALRATIGAHTPCVLLYSNRS